MAEEKEEKSNFVVVFATLSIIAIIGVLLLKADETKHLVNPGAGTTLEGNAAALHDAKRFSNDNMGSLESPE
jgi:hypothetical protein